MLAMSLLMFAFGELLSTRLLALGQFRTLASPHRLSGLPALQGSCTIASTAVPFEPANSPVPLLLDGFVCLE